MIHLIKELREKDFSECGGNSVRDFILSQIESYVILYNKKKVNKLTIPDVMFSLTDSMEVYFNAKKMTATEFVEYLKTKQVNET